MFVFILFTGTEVGARKSELDNHAPTDRPAYVTRWHPFNSCGSDRLKSEQRNHGAGINTTRENTTSLVTIQRPTDEVPSNEKSLQVTSRGNVVLLYAEGANFEPWQ